MYKLHCYNGDFIREWKNNYCLLDLTDQVNCSDDKSPDEWLKLPQIIEYASKIPDRVKTCSIWTGDRYHLFAHWVLAQAYADYLDPDLHIWINHIIRGNSDGQNLN